MERDFIQEGIERFEKRKEEIINKTEEELNNEIKERFSKIIEKYYGSQKSEEEREKELNDTFQKYCDKSLNNENRKIEISGRTYTSKEIKRNKILKYLVFAALALFTIQLIRSGWDSELLSAYRTIRDAKTSDFTKEEKELLDEINRDDLPRIREAIKNYDGPYTYTFGGDRTDGTHNVYYVFDKGALIQAGDKELDPIERLVINERKEIKGVEVDTLNPKPAGNVGIKEGDGEPIGSGRIR